MAEPSRSTKSFTHDFRSTFDVLVGQEPGRSERFTLHTDIFTRRSRFFAAARKPEWIAEDATKPVDLSDEDPELFQAYLNCVYMGLDTVEESREAFEREVVDGVVEFSDIDIHNLHRSVTNEQLTAQFEGFGEIKKCTITIDDFYCNASISFATIEAGKAAVKACNGLVVLNGSLLRVTADQDSPGVSTEHELREFEVADLHYKALISLYLLADKLQDITTANTVIDKIQKFCPNIEVLPGIEPISIAYQSTTEGSQLRKLLRDVWFYDTNFSCRKRFKDSGFPSDFLHDVVELYVGIKTIDDCSDFAHFTDIGSSVYLLDEPERSFPSKCRYHQHDVEHPLCLSREQEQRRAFAW